MAGLARVHGSYPRDFGSYRKVRDLSIADAAKLLGLDPHSVDEHSGIFINKGFVVLGLPLPRDFSKDLRPMLVGKQAVYNHDGHYRLIEWPEAA